MDHSPLESTTEVMDGVNLAQLASGEQMSLQYYSVAPGVEVPMHSHRHEQAGYVIQGTLTYIFEDGSETPVSAGESYVLRGNEAHAAENRGDTEVVGVEAFSPPRLDPPWDADE